MNYTVCCYKISSVSSSSSENDTLLKILLSTLPQPLRSLSFSESESYESPSPNKEDIPLQAKGSSNQDETVFKIEGEEVYLLSLRQSLNILLLCRFLPTLLLLQIAVSTTILLGNRS